MTLGRSGRCASVLAATAALCGLVACAADEGNEGPAVTADGSAARSIKELSVTIDNKLLFSDASGETRESVSLFEGGAATPGFRCPEVGEQVEQTLAVDRSNVAVRRLSVARAIGSATGFLGNLRPWGGEELVDDVFLSEPRLRVLPSGTSSLEKGHNGAVLAAELEGGIQNEPLKVNEDAGGGAFSATYVVLYDCWHDGQAEVELRFKVSQQASVSGEVCLRWTKVCARGFGGLVIFDGSVPAFEGGEVQAGWATTMQSEGTHDSVTKLSLSAEGIERIRIPVASSNQKLLKVEVRGPFYFSDNTFEVSTTPVSFSIIYTCEYDGFADVTLRFTKATLSMAHPAEDMALTWRKHCGAVPYTHLQVWIKSTTHDNKTAAVNRGEALPGFVRPCQMSTGVTRGPIAGDCDDSGKFALEIPENELRTVLELRVDQEAGTMEPPTFQPAPDLSYDRKAMMVTLLRPPKSGPPTTHTKGGRSTYKDKVQTMAIKYTCFRDGVSVVMVTLHVLAHKPIDIAWKKRCVEPKAKIGKSVITAPQAMVVAVVVTACVILAVLFICFICEPDDKRQLYGYDTLKGAKAGRQSIDELEFRDRRGGRIDTLQPTEFGGNEHQEEVIFH